MKVFLKFLFIFISFLYADLGFELVADKFKKPIYASYSHASNSLLFIAEQSGKIWEITDKGERNLFLDITSITHQPIFPGDERGLLGFAFSNKTDHLTLYVNFIDRSNYTRISRIKIDDSSYSEEVLLSFEQPYSNHNGGAMVFGPDDFLYIAVGDGGSAGDPENRAQDLSNYFGTILRIDVDTESSYSIPPDNPFLGNDNALDEIWMYGLRNPWRFTFDRSTGDMYIGDVGQHTWEEINFAQAGTGGQNYGWSRYEAHEIFNENINSENSIAPVYSYPNNANIYKVIFKIKEKNVSGCSITGGYVYRGRDVPQLSGRYVFGDYCTGKIFSISYINNEATDFTDLTDDIGIDNIYLSSFAEDKNGEIYLIDYSGNIYKINNY